MRLMTAAAIAILGSSMTVPAVLAADAAAPAPAPAPAKAPAGKLTTASPLGDLLDNPAAKAVVLKYLPVLGSAEAEQARPIPIKELQQYIPEMTNEMLGKMDAELAAIK